MAAVAGDGKGRMAAVGGVGPGRRTEMSIGARKALGMAILVVVMIVYVGALVVLADYVPDHWAVRLVFFAVAGVAWVFPLRGLLRWINRPEGDGDGTG